MTVQVESTADELRCHRCDYDLRAHPPEAVCSECGEPVAESKRIAAIPRRPAWRDSDPRWRRRVLAGVVLLLLMPLMDVLNVVGWSERIPVPNLVDSRGAVRTLHETMLSSWYGLYPSLIFFIGMTLLFAKERGRCRNRWDWTRRWGLICTFVVLLLSLTGLLMIMGLVGVGISALFHTLPPDFQPRVTPLFANFSANLLLYGPHPKPIAAEVQAGFASVAVLLACAPLYDALRSCGPKRAAMLLLAPLALFSVMQLAQLAMHILEVSPMTDADIFYLGQYFRSELLVRCLAGRVAGLKITGETLVLPIEITKWCVLLVVAGWLIVGRFTRWGRGERRE